MSTHWLSLGELLSSRDGLRFAGCLQFAIKEFGVRGVQCMTAPKTVHTQPGHIPLIGEYLARQIESTEVAD